MDGKENDEPHSTTTGTYRSCPLLLLLWHFLLLKNLCSSFLIPPPPPNLCGGGALIIKLLLLFSPHPLLDIIGVGAGEREIEVERRVMVWGGRAKLRCWEIAESILWGNLFRSLGNKSLHQIIEFYFFREKLLKKKKKLSGKTWGDVGPPSLPQKAF